MGELPRIVREARQARLAQLHLPAFFDCDRYPFQGICDEPAKSEQVDPDFTARVEAFKQQILTGKGLSCEPSEVQAVKLSGELAPNEILCLPEPSLVAA